MFSTLLSITENLVKVVAVPLVIVNEVVAKPVGTVAEALTDSLKDFGKGL